MTSLIQAGRIADLVRGGGQYSRVSMCALVLEDEPVGRDSKLEFESFPGEIEETYAVNDYREMGGERMPQPSHVAYRGGNWSVFTLQLIFRAGIKRPGLQQPRGSRYTISNAELEQLLIEMEAKVRWCQALTFPLARSLGDFETRRLERQISAAQSSFGLPPSTVTTEQIANLRRNDPPVVLVVFGSWWTQRCYCTNVTIKWQGPWHPESVRPYGAEVTLTFKPLKAVYPTWNLIRNQAGAGGYTTDQDNTGPTLSGYVNNEQSRDAARASNNAAAAGGV